MKTSFAIWPPSANCLPSACQLESGLSRIILGFLARKQMAIAICVCQLANCQNMKRYKGFEQLASWQIFLLLRSNAAAALKRAAAQLRHISNLPKGNAHEQ